METVGFVETLVSITSPRGFAAQEINIDIKFAIYA
jgi:hypothetical protein